MRLLLLHSTAHELKIVHGEGYWLRDPSPREADVMKVLALNHRAQGIISWLWPTSEILAAAHGALASVVTKSPVLDFLVGGDTPHPVRVVVPGSYRRSRFGVLGCGQQDAGERRERRLRRHRAGC